MAASSVHQHQNPAQASSTCRRSTPSLTSLLRRPAVSSWEHLRQQSCSRAVNVVSGQQHHPSSGRRHAGVKPLLAVGGNILPVVVEQPQAAKPIRLEGAVRVYSITPKNTRWQDLLQLLPTAVLEHPSSLVSCFYTRSADRLGPQLHVFHTLEVAVCWGLGSRDQDLALLRTLGVMSGESTQPVFFSSTSSTGGLQLPPRLPPPLPLSPPAPDKFPNPSKPLVTLRYNVQPVLRQTVSGSMDSDTYCIAMAAVDETAAAAALAAAAIAAYNEENGGGKGSGAGLQQPVNGPADEDAYVIDAEATFYAQPPPHRELPGALRAACLAAAEAAKVYELEQRMARISEQTASLPQLMAECGDVRASSSDIAKLIAQVFLVKAAAAKLAPPPQHTLERFLRGGRRSGNSPPLTPQPATLNGPPHALALPATSALSMAAAEAAVEEGVATSSTLYRALREEMDTEARLAALGSGVELSQEVLQLLQERNSDYMSVKLEWIVIWLIAVEALIGCFELVELFLSLAQGGH